MIAPTIDDQHALDVVGVVGADRHRHRHGARIDRERQRQEDRRRGRYRRALPASRPGRARRRRRREASSRGGRARVRPRAAPTGMDSPRRRSTKLPKMSEPKSRMNELMAMRHASALRVALSAPRVMARNIGALPIGLTMGSSAAHHHQDGAQELGQVLIEHGVSDGERVVGASNVAGRTVAADARRHGAVRQHRCQPRATRGAGRIRACAVTIARRDFGYYSQLSTRAAADAMAAANIRNPGTSMKYVKKETVDLGRSGEVTLHVAEDDTPPAHRIQDRSAGPDQGGRQRPHRRVEGHPQGNEALAQGDRAGSRSPTSKQ